MNDAERVEMLVKWLERMSAHEALDLQLERIALIGHTEERIFVQVALYITFVSAFLAAAYVGGKNLSRAQTLIGSAIFAACASLTAWTVMGSIWMHKGQYAGAGMYYLAMAETYERPDWLVLGQNFMDYSKAVWDNHITAGMMILGIIASLYFMWEQRQAKTE